MKNFIIAAIATVFLGSAIGCAKGQDVEVLTALRAEQSLNGVVIGRQNYQQLEILAVSQELHAERILIPVKAVLAGNTAGPEEHGEWKFSCDAALCTISDLKTGVKQTIDAGSIIGPLQWSPD